MERTLTVDEAAALGGMVGGALTALYIFLFAWLVLMIIAGWKIFKKAGEPGWKVLIPIYDCYILFKIVGMKTWFWITFAVTLVASIAIVAMGFDTNTMSANSFSGETLVPALIYTAMAIFVFIVGIMYSVRLSKAFGHGIGFTLGLIFLSGIFMLILGFDKSKYNKKLVASWSK